MKHTKLKLVHQCGNSQVGPLCETKIVSTSSSYPPHSSSVFRSYLKKCKFCTLVEECGFIVIKTRIMGNSMHNRNKVVQKKNCTKVLFTKTFTLNSNLHRIFYTIFPGPLDLTLPERIWK